MKPAARSLLPAFLAARPDGTGAAPSARPTQKGAGRGAAARKKGAPDFDALLQAAHAPREGSEAGKAPRAPAPAEPQAAAAPARDAAKAPAEAGEQPAHRAPARGRAIAGEAPRDASAPAQALPTSQAAPQPTTALFSLSSTPPDAPALPARVESPAGAAAPPPPVDAAHTLMQLAMTDTSLTVDVRQQVVSLALETEAAGPLELELRLHDGRAHVFVEGPGSPLVAQHAPALREVLSQQGLTLGEFSTSTSSHQRQGEAEARADAEAPPHPPAPPVSVTAPSRQRRHEGRIDVEA